MQMQKKKKCKDRNICENAWKEIVQKLDWLESGKYPLLFLAFLETATDGK